MSPPALWIPQPGPSWPICCLASFGNNGRWWSSPTISRWPIAPTAWSALRMVSLKASGPNIVGASSNVTSSIKGGGIPARLICLLIMTGQGMWVNKVQLLLTLLTMAVGSLALSLTYFLGEGARIYLWQDMEQLMGDWVFASAVATQDSHILETR